MTFCLRGVQQFGGFPAFSGSVVLSFKTDNKSCTMV